MTTYQFGPFTLEEFKPREWRAWVTVSDNVPLKMGDEVHVLNEGWLPLEERELSLTNDGTLIFRRPVPLPSIGELAEVASIPEGVFKIAPSHQDVCAWLRALLPGYEEQLAKERIITTLARPGVAEELARRLEAEEPVDMDEAKPTPVPADGWRPWHHSVKYVTRVKKMPVDRWVDRDEFDTEEEARADLAFVAPLLPSLKCHIVRREVTEHVLEPLPPPPQEKGGEA
jgi:hypothetical protein